MVKHLLLHTVYWHNSRYCCFFLSKNNYLTFTLFFVCLWNIKKRPLGLWKVCHCSTRSLSWFWQESVTALLRVCHGCVRIPSCFNIASRSIGQSQQVTDSSQSHEGLLTEPPNLTDFSQSYDRLLAEPWRTFYKPRGLILGFQKHKKQSENNVNIISDKNNNTLHGVSRL